MFYFSLCFVLVTELAYLSAVKFCWKTLGTVRLTLFLFALITRIRLVCMFVTCRQEAARIYIWM